MSPTTLYKSYQSRGTRLTGTGFQPSAFGICDSDNLVVLPSNFGPRGCLQLLVILLHRLGRERVYGRFSVRCGR